MTTTLSALRKSGRAALVALALGAVSIGTTSFTAAPAMAQSSFSFSFGIQGGGDNFSFGVGKRGERYHRSCLTNKEIYRGLRHEGFSDIHFLSRRGNRVIVSAEDRRWEYRLSVHRCSGKVSILDRDRKARRDRHHSGFGLHFRF
jgi:hypothetical protein